MKYLYPVALLLLLLVSCQKEKKKVLDRTKTDWAFYKLQCNVKSISQRTHLPETVTSGKQKPDNTAEVDSNIEFNENGMLVSEKKFLHEKTIEELKYDGREKVVMQTQYMGDKPVLITTSVWNGKNNTLITRKNPDNSQLDRIAMKYANNNLIEKITYNGQDNRIDKYTYVYDNKGNVKEENIFMERDEVQYKTLYEYNAKNQKISEARTDKDLKVIYKTTFEYDGDKVIKAETKDANGKLDYLTKSTYDKKGNVLTHYTFESFKGSETTDKYAYDTNGNKISWKIIKGTTPYMTVNYKYDKHNNLTDIKVTNAKNTVIDERSYRFEYDTKGNWIKKTAASNGTPTFITERKITYFE